MAVSDALMLQNTGIAGGGPAYANEFANNSIIEEQIGLALAQDARVAQFASNINAAAAIPHANALPLSERGEIDIQNGTYGGAQATTDDVDTLGRSVFEAMHHIERDKDFYSRVHNNPNERNPYFGGENNKKPEFDQPLSDIDWAQLPQNLTATLDPGAVGSPFQTLNAGVYNSLKSDAKLTILSEYRRNSVAAANTQIELTTQLGAPVSAMAAAAAMPGVPAAVAAAVGVVNANMAAIAVTPKAVLRANITAAINAIPGVVALAPLKAELGALYDIVADEHTSGDNTNLVQLDRDRHGNEVDNEKNRWIKDTIAAGKPIISGPSGHTLRYLNFWAEQRAAGGPAAVGPSLEAARLVMMADLMPPKHHSYDEIMTASIGISDGPATLRYAHKSSYEDLNIHAHVHVAPDAINVANDAYTTATFEAVMNGAAIPANNANIDALSDINRQSVSNLIKKLQDYRNAPNILPVIGQINILIGALPH